MNVVAGQPAPDFTARASDGSTWSLREQLGHPVVLYFYPRDESSGCTVQAESIRDRWQDFERAGAHVVGISPDDVASHRTFRSGHGLPQELLVDANHDVMRSYGAWGEKVKDGKTVEGVIRSSVVIDASGIVLAVFSPIVSDEQAQRTLAVLSGTVAR